MLSTECGFWSTSNSSAIEGSVTSARKVSIMSGAYGVISMLMVRNLGTGASSVNREPSRRAGDGRRRCRPHASGVASRAVSASRFEPVQVESVLSRFSGRRVAVLGDCMLDRYLWGRVERISPEAPVPVVEIERESVGSAAPGTWRPT